MHPRYRDFLDACDPGDLSRGNGFLRALILLCDQLPWCALTVEGTVATLYTDEGGRVTLDCLPGGHGPWRYVRVAWHSQRSRKWLRLLAPLHELARFLRADFVAVVDPDDRDAAAYLAGDVSALGPEESAL